MRKYGVLTDNGDCVYLYEELNDLIESVFEESPGTLGATDQIIKIESYSVLANGPSIRVS